MSGPASAIDVDVSLQQAVVAEDDVPMAPDGTGCAHSHVGGNGETEENVPPMADLQFAASDLSNAGMDVEKATQEC